MKLKENTDVVKHKLLYVKAEEPDGSSLPEGVIKVVATDTTVDRANDRVDPTGMSIEAYLKNPVVLYGHDHDKVIGKAIAVEKDAARIVATLKFDLEDKLGAETYRKLKQGFLNAVSIGFLCKTIELDESSDEYVWVLSDTELIEISVVSVPCNPNAVVVERSIEQDVPVVKSIEKPVEEINEPIITEKQIMNSETENLKATLKTLVTDEVAGAVEALKGDFEKSFHIPSNKANKYDGLKEGEAFSKALPGMIQAVKGGYGMGQYIEDTKKSDPDFYQKFLGENAANQGGDKVIPQPLAADVIPALYKRLAIVKAGATYVDMPSGRLDFGRQNVKSTASYVAEGAAIGRTGPGFERISLNSRKLTAIAPVSGEFLRRDAIVGLDFVAQDLVKAAAQAMDNAFLYGAGTTDIPNGIFNQMLVANKFTLANTAATLEEFEEKLDQLEKAVLDGNHWGNFKYIIGDRAFLKMRRTRDGGAPVWGNLSDVVPHLRGYEVIRTNMLKENGSDGGTPAVNNMADMLFGDFSSLIVGISSNMQLDVSEHSQFRNDLVDVRLIMEHDILLRYNDAISALSENYTA